jgi:CRP-like cAMP-binding protein
VTANALPLLNAHDWKLLDEQVTRLPFRRGETILLEGGLHRALMVVRSGAVRVERAEQGQGITLAQLGAGEIFGEMGFVENAPASASVIAETDGMVDVIDAAALQSVMASEPGFAVRFYHSLAVTLTTRLRQTSRRLAQAGAVEAAQVNRFRVARTGNISARQVPAELSHSLEEFERTVLSADQRLRAQPQAHVQIAGEVARACEVVVDLLSHFTKSDPLIDIGLDDLLAFRDTSQLEVGIGDYIFRETFPTFMLSATMARCYAKPRGFPDDHQTMLDIYRDDPEGDGRLGPIIDRWFLDRPICRSRRASRNLMRDMLEQIVGAHYGAGPFRIAALASGAAAELFDICRSDVGQSVIATCVDLDREALLAAGRAAEQDGLSGRISFLQGNVLPADGEGPSLVEQNAIYALGLGEYLNDEQFIALLNRTFDKLAPGGSFIFTALADSNPDRLLMDHILDWKTYHRTPESFREVVLKSQFGASAVEVIPDETGTTLFARGVRPGA